MCHMGIYHRPALAGTILANISGPAEVKPQGFQKRCCFWRQDPNCGSIVSAVGAAAAPGSVTVTAIPGPGGLHVHLQPVGAEDKFCHIPLRFV